MKMDTILQSADWKTEKHVPVIECAEQVAAGEWAVDPVWILK